MLRESSYNHSKCSYEDVFQTICFIQQPKVIVEFGILDGFSLKCFEKYSPNDCKVYAYDIFDDFNGNHANETQLRAQFQGSPKVIIEKQNFFEHYKCIEDKSIDILHIDIANDGDILNYTITHYLPKIKDNGIILFEGGSSERDNVYWMNKYNKTKINPVLNTITVPFTVINVFPSLTIIQGGRLTSASEASP
jgi:hypothetical protein